MLQQISKRGFVTQRNSCVPNTPSNAACIRHRVYGRSACVSPSAIRKTSPGSVFSEHSNPATSQQTAHAAEEHGLTASTSMAPEVEHLGQSINPLAALGVCTLALASCEPAFAAGVPANLGLYIPGIVGDSPASEGFVSGFLLILFSEIGDKTFFIALLLALKQSKSAVFVGTFGALAIMTVISVLLGQVFHQVDELIPQGSTPIPIDDLIAVVLLIFFGVKTIQVGGRRMP